MAADLEHTPRAGLDAQLCGDAHLSNFGLYASPERTLVFDLNDFDETLPGPFEYDVKRMAASFTIAARNNGFTEADARSVTMASVAAYREAMAEFAGMPTMDVWHARLSEQDIIERDRTNIGRAATARRRRRRGAPRSTRPRRATRRALADSLSALSKLAERVDGQYRIVYQPPIVIPAREVGALMGISADEIQHRIHTLLTRVPRHAATRSAPPARGVRAGRRGSQGRRGRQCQGPVRTSRCCKVAISTTPCSCR